MCKHGINYSDLDGDKRCLSLTYVKVTALLTWETTASLKLKSGISLATWSNYQNEHHDSLQIKLKKKCKKYFLI